MTSAISREPRLGAAKATTDEAVVILQRPVVKRKYPAKHWRFDPLIARNCLADPAEPVTSLKPGLTRPRRAASAPGRCLRHGESTLAACRRVVSPQSHACDAGESARLDSWLSRSAQRRPGQ